MIDWDNKISKISQRTFLLQKFSPIQEWIAERWIFDGAVPSLKESWKHSPRFTSLRRRQWLTVPSCLCVRIRDSSNSCTQRNTWKAINAWMCGKHYIGSWQCWDDMTPLLSLPPLSTLSLSLYPQLPPPPHSPRLLVNAMIERGQCTGQPPRWRNDP